MDLQTIRARIEEQVGLSTTVSDVKTRVNSWINETYKRLASEANWPWLYKRDIIQTVADITTGTIAITNGDTALTFSSGPTPSVANDYRIQFTDDSDDWYDISAHTAGATTATLADSFGGTTQTTGAYILRKFFYSLPSDVDRIFAMTEARSDHFIQNVDSREILRLFPDPTDTGKPTAYSFAGLDSSNIQQIRFFPTPDVAENIDIWYYRTITELSADTDTPIFPAKWHNILVHGAMAFFGWPTRNDDRQRESEKIYFMILDEMKRSLYPTTDRVIQVKAWDRRFNPNAGGVSLPRFPPEFGVL